MPSILEMIANPTVAQPGAQFRAGQQEGLQTSLLRGQLGAQQTQQKAQADVGKAVGTSSFQTKLQQLAAVDPVTAQKIQSTFQGIQEADLKNAFSNIAIASGLPGINQNQFLETANQSLSARPDLQNIVKGLIGTPPEQRAEVFQAINQIGQQLDIIETPAAPTKTADQIEREIAVKEGTLEVSQKKAATAEATGDVTVGAQEILEDGTVIQSTPKGIRVFNPEGVQVKGTEAKKAIATARAEKVSNLRKAAGGKKKASLEAQQELEGLVAADVISKTEAAKTSVKAFDKLAKINTNIGNINEAIDLIDQGAQTGAIASKFPSIRAASVKLDNLQGRLGLDVIGNTTFGALSESELRFALDTALPQKLKGPTLKKWLIEKRDSQEKLADYIEASAIFLGTPGNTVSRWIQKQKVKSVAPETQTQAPAQILNFDAQGNQIQ